MKKTIKQFIDIEPCEQTFTLQKQGAVSRVSLGKRLQITATLPTKLMFCVRKKSPSNTFFIRLSIAFGYTADTTVIFSK